MVGKWRRNHAAQGWGGASTRGWEPQRKLHAVPHYREGNCIVWRVAQGIPHSLGEPKSQRSGGRGREEWETEQWVAAGAQGKTHSGRGPTEASAPAPELEPELLPPPLPGQGQSWNQSWCHRYQVRAWYQDKLQQRVASGWGAGMKGKQVAGRQEDGGAKWKGVALGRVAVGAGTRGVAIKKFYIKNSCSADFIFPQRTNMTTLNFVLFSVEW